MKGPFNPSCDRYGHLLTSVGGSPQVMAPFTFPTAEEIALSPGVAKNSRASTVQQVEIQKEMGPFSSPKNIGSG
jgi:hypothetical protein